MTADDKSPTQGDRAEQERADLPDLRQAAQRAL